MLCPCLFSTTGREATGRLMPELQPHPLPPGIAPTQAHGLAAPTNEGSKIRISCVSSMPVRHIFRPAPGAPSPPGGYRHTPCRAQVCQRAGKGRVARGHGKALAPPEPSPRLHVCSLFFSTKKYRQINISYLCRANRRPGCFRTEITLPWQFGIGVAAGLKVMGRLFSVVKQMKNISASRLAE